MAPPSISATTTGVWPSSAAYMRAVLPYCKATQPFERVRARGVRARARARITHTHTHPHPPTHTKSLTHIIRIFGVDIDVAGQGQEHLLKLPFLGKLPEHLLLVVFAEDGELCGELCVRVCVGVKSLVRPRTQL